VWFGSRSRCCCQWFIGDEGGIFQDFMRESKMLCCERGKFGFRIVEQRMPAEGKGLQSRVLTALQSQLRCDSANGSGIQPATQIKRNSGIGHAITHGLLEQFA